MIERIEAMPAGTIGLRAGGTLTKDDYVRVLEPAIQAGIDAGELRLLFELGEFDGLAQDAWVEDAKTALKAYVKERRAWRRFALVTDVEWVAKSMRTFAWMVPGEARVFPLDELGDARDWVAG